MTIENSVNRIHSVVVQRKRKRNSKCIFHAGINVKGLFYTSEQLENNSIRTFCMGGYYSVSGKPWFAQQQ